MNGGLRRRQQVEVPMIRNRDGILEKRDESVTSGGITERIAAAKIRPFFCSTKGRSRRSLVMSLGTAWQAAAYDLRQDRRRRKARNAIGPAAACRWLNAVSMKKRQHHARQNSRLISGTPRISSDIKHANRSG